MTPLRADLFLGAQEGFWDEVGRVREDVTGVERVVDGEKAA